MVGEIILTMLDLRVLMATDYYTIIAIVGNLPAASVEDVKVGVSHRSAVRLVWQVRGPLDQSEMSIEVTWPALRQSQLTLVRVAMRQSKVSAVLVLRQPQLSRSKLHAPRTTAAVRGSGEHSPS